MSKLHIHVYVCYWLRFNDQSRHHSQRFYQRQNRVAVAVSLFLKREKINIMFRTKDGPIYSRLLNCSDKDVLVHVFVNTVYLKKINL